MSSSVPEPPLITSALVRSAAANSNRSFPAPPVSTSGPPPPKMITLFAPGRALASTLLPAPPPVAGVGSAARHPIKIGRRYGQTVGAAVPQPNDREADIFGREADRAGRAEIDLVGAAAGVDDAVEYGAG